MALPELGSDRSRLTGFESGRLAATRSTVLSASKMGTSDEASKIGILEMDGNAKDKFRPAVRGEDDYEVDRLVFVRQKSLRS